MVIAPPSIMNKRKEKTMEQNQDRQYAKELLDWIKKLSWEENDARTQASLKFEINPFNGDGSVNDDARESLSALTFDDVKFIVDSLACERIDSFQIDALTFKYDGDLEEGVIEVESEIHLSE